MEQSHQDINYNNENWDYYRAKSKRNIENKNDFKRIPCRYGHGCTHTQDLLHIERFTHPAIPIVDGILHTIFLFFIMYLAESIKTNFMCYECGMMFLTLPDLQVFSLFDYFL